MCEGDVIRSARNKKPVSPVRTAPNPAVLALAMLLVPVGIWLGVQAKRTYIQADRLRIQNDLKERDIATLEYNNQRAEHEIKALDTPSGVDMAARPLGWVAPGERRIHPPSQ